MVRLDAQRWAGRRFASVDEMHRTLDLLLDHGFGEETILDHLPSNPVATQHEFANLLATYGGDVVIQPALESRTRPCLGHVLEFVEQVRNLLASADRPACLCDRFLRAIGGLLPFGEMVIYLRERTGNGYVIAATAERHAAATPGPQAHPCRLESEGLGATAMAEGCLMADRDGRHYPPGDHLVAGEQVALPLMLGADCGLGVWMASGTGQAIGDFSHGEALGLMRIFGDMLSNQLSRLIAHGAGTPNEQPSGISDGTTSQADLSGLLATEIARASRFDAGLAVVRLQLMADGCRPDSLPVEQIERILHSTTRPYDRVFDEPDQPLTWTLVLPETHDLSAHVVASRLLMAIEDLLDSRGGTEEQGIRVGAGVALWGADAATPEGMIKGVQLALHQAMDGHPEHQIRFYREAAPVQHTP